MTSSDPLLRRPFRSRRLVLGAALAAGLACAILAAGDRPLEPALVADALAAEPSKDAAPAAAEPAPKSKPAAVDAEISITETGISIRKNRSREDPQVVPDEFDSFEEFVEQAPWLAALVFLVTGLFFLVPLLIVALIIWYKMRSNRMRNETMLKLAERGIVATPDSLVAIPAVAPLPGQPPMTPLYEQVRQVRKRTAWSDLRKGVVMLGIGVGLTFFSMLDDGTPNSVGLVLLFVGVGFVVLWYFEERQLTAPRDSGTGPTGGGV